MKYGFGEEKDLYVNIRVLFWNVNGFITMIKAPEVSGWLHKNFDLCFVIETHMTKGEKFDLEGFKCFNHPFSDVLASKPREGLMCLIKQEFMQYVMEVNRDNPDIIVVNLHGGNTIFGIYIPPSDSI